MTHEKPDPAMSDEEHRISQGVIVDQDFRNLLEASSLGSPAARRIRSLTPSHAVDAVHQRVSRGRRDPKAGDAASPCQDTDDSSAPANQVGASTIVPQLWELADSGAGSRQSTEAFLPETREITDLPAFYGSVADMFLKSLIGRLDKATLAQKPSRQDEWRELVAGARRSNIDLIVEPVKSSGEEEVNLSIFESKRPKAEIQDSSDQTSIHKTDAYSPAGLYISTAPSLINSGGPVEVGVVPVTPADNRVIETRVNAVKVLIVGDSSVGKSAVVGLCAPPGTGKTALLAALIDGLAAGYESASVTQSRRSVFELQVEDHSWLGNGNGCREMNPQVLATGNDLEGWPAQPGSYEVRHTELRRHIMRHLAGRIEGCEQPEYPPDSRSGIHGRRFSVSAIAAAAMNEHGGRRWQSNVAFSLTGTRMREVSVLTRAKSPDNTPIPRYDRVAVWLDILAGAMEHSLDEIRAQLRSMRWMLIGQDSFSVNKEWRVSLQWDRPREIAWQHAATSDGFSHPAWDPGLLLFTCPGHGPSSGQVTELFQPYRQRAVWWLSLDDAGNWLDGSLPEPSDARNCGDSDSDNSGRAPGRGIVHISLTDSGPLELLSSGQQPPADLPAMETSDGARGCLGTARRP